MPRCRICWEETLPLYELPCECKGDLKLIHRACFEKWMHGFAGARHQQCDVCSARIIETTHCVSQQRYDDAMCPFRNLARIAFVFFLYYVLALAAFAASWCMQVLRDTQIYSADVQVTAVFIFAIIVCTFALATACSRTLFMSPAASRNNVDVASVLLPWHPLVAQDTIKCA